MLTSANTVKFLDVPPNVGKFTNLLNFLKYQSGICGKMIKHVTERKQVKHNNLKINDHLIESSLFLKMATKSLEANGIVGGDQTSAGDNAR